MKSIISKDYSCFLCYEYITDTSTLTFPRHKRFFDIFVAPWNLAIVQVFFFATKYRGNANSFLRPTFRPITIMPAFKFDRRENVHNNYECYHEDRENNNLHIIGALNARICLMLFAFGTSQKRCMFKTLLN